MTDGDGNSVARKRYEAEQALFDKIAAKRTLKATHPDILERYRQHVHAHLYGKEKMFELLGDASGKKILEVGCSHLIRIKLEVIFTFAFYVVHGNVGVFDEGIHVCAVIGKERYSDTRADVELMLVDGIRQHRVNDDVESDEKDLSESRREINESQPRTNRHRLDHS